MKWLKEGSGMPESLRGSDQNLSFYSLSNQPHVEISFGLLFSHTRN